MEAVTQSDATARVPLLIRPGFLDRPSCERIRRAMDRGIADAAEIVGDEISTRERVRHARSIEIDPSLLTFVEGRLDSLRSAIAKTVGRRIGDREGTGFLRYQQGGFYRQHRDRGDVAGWAAAARRAVTVVIFLNGQSEADHADFKGGHLWLYPDTPAEPLEIRPETGLLVAFPSDVLHEVEPVYEGIRDAAVDWFYDG